jgi:hypothetical protein
MKKNNESGQVLLMVLLTVMISLSVALAVFSNTLSNVSNKITQENSEKALSAAESGIERILISSSDNLHESGIEMDGRLIDLDVSSELLDGYFEQYMERNSTLEVILDNGEDTPPDTVDLFWTLNQVGSDEMVGGCGEGSDNAPAGLVVEIWSDSGIRYESYQPYGCTTMNDVEFIISGNGSADGFNSYIEITINNGDYLMKISPVYHAATVRIQDDDLPDQQRKYTSNATVEDSLESSSITLVKNNPKLPDVFNYVLYSQNAITQSGVAYKPPSILIIRQDYVYVKNMEIIPKSIRTYELPEIPFGYSTTARVSGWVYEGHPPIYGLCTSGPDPGLPSSENCDQLQPCEGIEIMINGAWCFTYDDNDDDGSDDQRYAFDVECSGIIPGGENILTVQHESVTPDDPPFVACDTGIRTSSAHFDIDVVVEYGN